MQERFGHSGNQITTDVYAHTSKKIENDGMSKFEVQIQKVYKWLNAGDMWAPPRPLHFYFTHKKPLAPNGTRGLHS